MDVDFNVMLEVSVGVICKFVAVLDNADCGRVFWYFWCGDEETNGDFKDISVK